MKIIKFASIVLSIVIVCTSCQKQLKFDTNGVSVGTLKSDLSGGCSPVIFNGIYSVDSLLTNDNYVDVKVNISIEGSFEIRSDTVNGYSFYKTGTVGTGLNTIRLYASGKPLAVGVDHFTISYGTTICSFSITVFNITTGGALFTLGGSPGNCSVSSVNGVYQTGQAMAASNTVEMTVNVTAIGSYNVTGTSVNGVSFNATGTFINPGVQNIFLTASGTPVATGIFNFPVTNAATACDFPITFSNTAPPPGNMDYIPQSSFSNWTNRVVGFNPNDTAYVSVSPNSINLSGNTYRIFETANLTAGMPPSDSTYHRKNAGMYYHLFNEKYNFDNNFNQDGLLLDSSLAAGANWIVNLGTNMWGGLSATGSISASILEKGSSAVIAGNTFTNIIKVEYIFRHNIGGAGNVEYNRLETWYAKGVGMVYNKFNNIPATIITEDELIRYQVF